MRSLDGDFLKRLEQLRCWNQQPISGELKRRIEGEYHRLQLVEVQIREIKKSQAERLKAANKDAVMEKVRRLQQLVGIGMGLQLGFRHGVVRVEKLSQSARGRRGDRANANTVQQRRQCPRTRHQSSRQSSCTETGDRDCVVLAAATAQTVI
jgi:hypothetical protein